MGYYSRVEGEITIDPPLRWSEIKDSPFRPDGDQEISMVLVVEESRADIPDGEQITRCAVLARPRWEDISKYYCLDSDLQKLASSHSDRTFTGCLIRYGEDNGDVERYRIERGRVVTEKAVLTWPDGTTEPTR